MIRDGAADSWVGGDLTALVVSGNLMLDMFFHGNY
jgi:hypothetical protein